MNSANALGFFVLGVTMSVLPVVAPLWFPHTAIDGSSTRALWTQLMGLVQCGLGFGFLVQHAHRRVQSRLATAGIGVRRGAVATADWESESMPETMVATAFRPTSAGVRSLAAVAETPVMLQGRRAALWRMIERACETEDRLAQFLIHSAPRELARRSAELTTPLAQAGSSFDAMYDLLTNRLAKRPQSWPKAA